MSNVPQIDVEQIKQYNAAVEKYKDMSKTLGVQIQMNDQEMDRLCAELTAELGEAVTKENVEEVAQRLISQYQMTLQNGKTIFDRIEKEQQAIQFGVSTLPVAAVSGQIATAANMMEEDSSDDWQADVAPPMPPAYVPPVPPPPVFEGMGGVVTPGTV